MAWRLLTLAEYRYRVDRLTGKPGSSSDYEPYLASLVERARARAREWGGEVYLVYLPRFRPYYYRSLDEAYMHRDQILEALDHQGAPVIDFHQVAREIGDPASLFPLGVRGHYNELAYRLLARQICDALVSPAELSQASHCEVISETAPIG